MDKNFYFLSGLFRSGNTVLSAILNQNPKVYVSPISPVVDYMWESFMILLNREAVISNDKNLERSEKLILEMIKVYYQDVEKPIILDRSKAWINPDNLLMIKSFTASQPKIIFTTRPLLEIVTSYINIAKERISKDMHLSNFILDDSLSINDNLANFLFSEHSNFNKTIEWAFSSIDNPENNENIHIVKYEDLISTPQPTMNGIYDFLEIDRYSHDFYNIEKIEKYNEDAIGASPDLHKVRKTLKKSGLKAKDFFTDEIIEKYKDLRYY